MKRRRWLFLIIALLVLAGGGLRWWISPSGFRTPDECLTAYREACLAGDAGRIRNCLGEPLSSRAEDAAAARMAGLKGWSQSVESIREKDAVVVVDEIRSGGIRRVRYRLERTANGWLIARIDPPENIPPAVPFGTHISKVLAPDVEPEQKK
jgi:hypothetical protein